MNSAATNTTFSISYRHHYSTDFAGDISSVVGAPSGINRFVGDQNNRCLRCFSDQIDQLADPANCCLNPIVLYGPSGTGKTSVAMALISRLSEQSQAGNSSIFWSAQDFDRRYRMALEKDSLVQLRQKIDHSAGLVIDNIDALDGKFAVQRELLKLLDRRVHVPLIFTLKSFPTAQPGFYPQLISRLAAGLVLPIEPPGPAARRHIICELAHLHLLNFTDDAIDLMVNQFMVTVPKLVHLMTQISSGLRAAIDFQVNSIICTQQLIKLFHKDPTNVDRFAAATLKAVAKKFHIKVSDIKSNSRKQSIVLARSIAIYLIRELSACSFQQIGRFSGNRDHSTIMHSYRKIKTMIQPPCSADDMSTIQILDQLKLQLADVAASQSNWF